jgi:hypothetical protein
MMLDTVAKLSSRWHIMLGRKFSDYVRFEGWILILIVVMFLVRLGLSLNGSSFSQIRWFSINLVLLLGLIYCSIAVHTRKFGSYRQLLGLMLVQNVLAHLLIAVGIIIGIVTARTNVFTVPEVSGGGDGATWVHASAHVLAGFLAALVAWGIGSLILLVTRKAGPA